jgi:ferredoxin
MRVERAEFDEFTGEPIYSKWLGPREENRAIFVNEVECIGCLKCALIASNTFAIENKYGRARAVGQWGDSESTINDAIRSCPVDCISLVEREKLAALEFIMSKQPRVLVGIDMHSYGGQRTENVFATTDKFLRKCAEREKLKRSNLQETARQREARMAAAEGIQARAGWWWHHFIGKSQFGDMSSWNPESARASTGAIIPLSWVTLPDSDKPSGFQYKSHTSPSIPEELGPLFEAAAQRRQKGSSAPRINSKANAIEDEYWFPAEPLSCPLPSTSFTKTKPVMDNGRNPQSNGNPRQTWIPYDDVDNMVAGWLRSILAVAPLVASVTAAVLVGMTSGMDAAISSEVPHAAGPLPAEFTSSVIVQMFLAAAVWYAVGTAVSGLTLVLAMFFVTMKRQKED